MTIRALRHSLLIDYWAGWWGYWTMQHLQNTQLQGKIFFYKFFLDVWRLVISQWKLTQFLGPIMCQQHLLWLTGLCESRKVHVLLHNVTSLKLQSQKWLFFKRTYTLNLAILSFQCSSSAVGPMSSASFLILKRINKLKLVNKLNLIALAKDIMQATIG